MSLPRWSPLVPAVALTALLMVFADRYGYHRDELYFLEAGHHPTWGYPDQPALVPLLARGWDAVVGGSLWGLRLLPAVLAGVVVLVAAATCREVGGTTRAHAAVAAAMTATASTLLAVGHLFSTTMFDAAATSALVLLLLRALRLGGPGPWLALGAATGLALHVKTLPGVVLACCAAGLLLCGPRRPLAPGWSWAGAVLALGIAAPVLWWQAAHGWPQLALARAIAAGSSGTSVERWLVVPLQVLVVGPFLVPLFVVGLLALWRSPHRWLAVAYAVLLAQTVATGGKPYYTLGLVPAVLAAAAPPVLRWARRRPRRPALVAGLLATNLVGGALAVLPWPPVQDAQPLVAVNYDIGEQVGWPELVATVEAAAAGLPATAVVVTGNYGEAGALSRARRAGAALPPVYSGHNAYADWGPPPASATTVLAVGNVGDTAPGVLGPCRTVARLTNRAGLDNDEDGRPVRVCRHSGTWAAHWERLRRLG